VAGRTQRAGKKTAAGRTKSPIRLGLIGCGQMGEALLRGLLAAKLVAPESVLASDPDQERMKVIVQRYGIRAARDNRSAASGATVLVLAVKPQAVTEMFAQLRDAVSDRTLVVSVITGIRLVRLEAELGGRPRVVRVVPNTPALVGSGMTAVAGGAAASRTTAALAGQRESVAKRCTLGSTAGSASSTSPLGWFGSGASASGATAIRLFSIR